MNVLCDESREGDRRDSVYLGGYLSTQGTPNSLLDLAMAIISRKSQITLAI